VELSVLPFGRIPSADIGIPAKAGLSTKPCITSLDIG
jgi:hypothetical protein